MFLLGHFSNVCPDIGSEAGTVNGSALESLPMTPEFEMMAADPDLQSEKGPGGTLIFLDGDQYCVIGRDFVSMEESDCYAFGSSRADAIANYAAKMGRQIL